MSADYYVFKEADGTWWVQERDDGVEWWDAAGPYDKWAEAYEASLRLSSGAFE